MIAEPAKPVHDMDFARKLVAGINEARRDARVAISCTGAHLSAVIDESVMKRNIIVCIISSLFVVLGLFYLTYRRFLPTLLIPLILLYGVTMALGVAGFFLPSIHIISFAFTALIIGLGTDYSIHLYDRFYSERSSGTDAQEALRRAVTDTGHGLFTAAFTTALPFLALVISDVRALSELGLLVGLGVLFSLYATFLFLPPLLVYSERRFPAAVYTPLPGFGLGRVWSFSRRHRRAVIALVLTSGGGFPGRLLFLTFEGELKNLQPRQLRGVSDPGKAGKAPESQPETAAGHRGREKPGRGHGAGKPYRGAGGALSAKRTDRRLVISGPGGKQPGNAAGNTG